MCVCVLFDLDRMKKYVGLSVSLEEQSKRRIDIFQRLLTTLVNVNEFSLKGQNYARPLNSCPIQLQAGTSAGTSHTVTQRDETISFFPSPTNFFDLRFPDQKPRPFIEITRGVSYFSLEFTLKL